jgi:dTDP-4-amino-4,6-dideoxygalactose transaminase
MIPMVDLKRQHLHLKAQIEAAVNGVMESTGFILGPNVTALEQEIAAYHQVPYAVGVANGTDAIRLSLKACGIGPGDEVLTTPFTFIAVAEVLLDVGAIPVFVDVSAETFTMDPERIEACITDRTKAIIPVHLFGHPEKMDIIMAISERNNLKVIEDCAQAFGSTFDGQMVGTFGHCGCYSFYPSKNLGCYGDGGMVITKDHDTADRIRMLRNHGSKKTYYHTTVGYNSRLDELQAAILRVKLKHIDAMNANRRKNAKLYCHHINSKAVILPSEAPQCKHVYHQFTLRSNRRDAIMEWLKEHRIASALFYPIPLHQQKIFNKIPIADVHLPVSEKLAGEVVSLPMFPELTEAEIVKISQIVTQATADQAIRK